MNDISHIRNAIRNIPQQQKVSSILANIQRIDRCKHRFELLLLFFLRTNCPSNSYKHLGFELLLHFAEGADEIDYLCILEPEVAFAKFAADNVADLFIWKLYSK